MKEQAPRYTPRFTYSAEEREALAKKGMNEKEIDDLEQKKNALLRNKYEEDMQKRAIESLEDNIRRSQLG